MIFGSLISLQILAHMPLANVKIPPNALELFEVMFTIVSFDFFPLSDFVDFGFSPTEPYTKNFEYLGYETINFIEGMGSIILFIWIGSILILIGFILWLKGISTATITGKCGKKFVEKFAPLRVWDTCIGFIQGTFFEAIVCVSVSMKMFEIAEFLNSADYFSIVN